jgi:hypothetical protein
LLIEKKITRENRLLLLKLAGTVQNTEIDNKPPHQLARGAGIKKKEVEKIQVRKREVSNQKMLKRILTVKKTFSVQRWEDEETQRQKYLQNMAEFPAVASTVQSNISGEGWGQTSSRSLALRPATAKTKREDAWNTNTTDVYMRDSNDLLAVKYEMPTPERVRKAVRPKTADSIRKKKPTDRDNREGGRSNAGAGAGAGGYSSGYGNSLGRNRPGYSNDPRDRDFDEEYKELFATAREDYRLQTAARTKKKYQNFM